LTTYLDINDKDKDIKKDMAPLRKFIDDNTTPIIPQIDKNNKNNTVLEK
jgi:hypothetical protein